MELITTILAMGTVVLSVSVGLSFIAQSLDSLKYNGTTSKNYHDYYQNPLHKINSKYFHYRPKGTVIVSKKKWEEIEKNIGLRIFDATRKGKIIGRREALKEIRDVVESSKEKAAPNSPYLLIGVKPTDPLESIEKRWDYLMMRYDPSNFVDLDPAFVDLARIRRKQLTRAWNSIRVGIAERGKS